MFRTNPLRLSVPAYYKQRGCHVSTQPAGFAAWLDELPYANLDTTIGSLSDTLTELNRTPLKTHQRFELLEITRPYFHRLFESHLQHLIQRSSDPHGLELYEAGTRLAMEMAYGYKIVVRELSEKKHAAEKMLLTATHRAMRHLSLLLMNAYYAYAPHPANTWREIYTLYQFAEQQRLLDIPQQDTLLDIILGQDNESTIHKLFKQMVLIGLLDPYRLPEGLLIFIYHYLHERAGISLIQTDDQGTKTHGLFQIELDSDATAQPSNTGTPHTPATRWINTLDLSNKIRHDQQSLLRGKQPAWTAYPHPLPISEAIQLLERLHQALCNKATRRSPRRQAHAQLEVVSGLQALYYMLNGEQAFDPERYHQNEGEPIDIGADIAHFPATPISKFPVEQWQAINQGKGGLALDTPGSSELHQGVGQLLGIKRPINGSSTWVVNVTRWFMRDMKRKRARLGVQHISPRAEVGVIRSLRCTQDNNGFQPALYVELAVRNGSMSTLLTPSGLFQQHAPFILMQGQQVQHIIATQLIEHSQSYDWFGFEPD